jgi:hypothetical protein
MHFADKKFLQALTKKRRVPALPVGTELRMTLTIKRELDPGLKRYLLDSGATPHEHTATISAATRFVPVYLVGPTDAQRERNTEFGGLSICLEGMEHRGIESGMVELPKTHGMDYADSLNYAFTRLSEVFEPWRKAHSGNIYERVFFQERISGHHYDDVEARILCADCGTDKADRISGGQALLDISAQEGEDAVSIDSTIRHEYGSSNTLQDSQQS